jgi:hypothetical protein
MRVLQAGQCRMKRTLHSGHNLAPAATEKPHPGQVKLNTSPQAGQDSSSSLSSG